MGGKVLCPNWVSGGGNVDHDVREEERQENSKPKIEIRTHFG